MEWKIMTMKNKEVSQFYANITCDSDFNVEMDVYTSSVSEYIDFVASTVADIMNEFGDVNLMGATTMFTTALGVYLKNIENEKLKNMS